MSKKYYQKKKALDPEYYIKRELARRGSIKQMTPSWANKFFISEIYDLAKRRREITGINWDVDHIIPLKGKTVCGLHVETNLRVIPASENRRKWNAFQ
jgi:hypothetical protein